jgi:hypothetical protein
MEKPVKNLIIHITEQSEEGGNHEEVKEEASMVVN